MTNGCHVQNTASLLGAGVTIVDVRFEILISVHGLSLVEIVAFSTILSLYHCDTSMMQPKPGG